MDKLVIDCATGAESVVPLTAAEVKARQDEAAATVVADAAQATRDANAVTLRQRAAAALSANDAFVTAAKPGTAAAQASQAYDQTVRLTRQSSALIRLALGLLDTTAGT